MGFSRSTLALFALNAAWLAGASYFIARQMRNAEEPRVEYVTNVVPIAKSSRVTIVTNTITSTNAFAWAQLESEDYRTYIQRLRAIGCPEQTIRDIVIADVDKLLAPRLQSASLQPKDLNYWQPIEQEIADDAAQRDAFLKQRAIDFEKREVIRELLGVDLVGERLRAAGQDDYHGARLQFLPEEKRARVRLLLDRYADQERILLEQQVEEGVDFAGGAELKRVQNEKNTALGQLLTPQEREQYDLWFSGTAARARETVYGMNASEDEFLKLYHLRQQYESQYGETLPPDAAQQFEANLQQALGGQRYAEYVRAQDADYRALFSVAGRLGMPKLAAELYSYKQIAADQARLVQEDASLAPAQKQAAQEAILLETQAAFKEALGEKAFRAYQRKVGRN